ncbi:MAG: hypothetical protein H6Q33_4899 [Deltaproteobacteria bacterium]|nr:hypothetical protein [Deltaproteobacteria bacterium]
MPDPAPPELVSRAKRVIGMFVAMVGSGIALESAAVWTGTGIMLAGLGLMIWGLAERAPTTPWVVPEPGGDVSAAPRAPESAP